MSTSNEHIEQNLGFVHETSRRQFEQPIAGSVELVHSPKDRATSQWRGRVFKETSRFERTTKGASGDGTNTRAFYYQAALFLPSMWRYCI